MRAFSNELKEEVFVATEGLGWPEQAKIVRAGADGTPITDGVFPESREKDVLWLRRFLTRLPALARATDAQGKAVSEHASESANDEIARLFETGLGQQ